MHTFILLLLSVFLTGFSIAQRDINGFIDNYMSSSNLEVAKLEKLEAIRTNTSLDSLKREKKWKKAYQKWDQKDTTASFFLAGCILSRAVLDSWRYKPNKEYPDISNAYLSMLLDITEEHRPKLFTEQTLMFLRNVLERREDVSQQLAAQEFETIFVEANRFGNETPILPDHFAVMTSYLETTHPESKDFSELIAVLQEYKQGDVEILIQHAERNGLSLNQLNTVPTFYYYPTNLTVGEQFRHDLLTSYQLFRHSADAHGYRTADSWAKHKFELYRHYLDNEHIRNMVLGMICYKKWFEYNLNGLNASRTGRYVKQVTSISADEIYDNLQTSQIKQLRLHMPAMEFAKDPFTQLLVAARNGVFFLPTDLSPKMIKGIEKIVVGDDFGLTKKERTVVDAIGPYRIRYQGERILKDKAWLSEHSKKSAFRLAVFLKLTQTAMQSEVDWYGQERDYRKSPFSVVAEDILVPVSQDDIDRQNKRLKNIKTKLSEVMKKHNVDSGRYVITCEGNRYVEVYPEVSYTVNAWLVEELRELNVKSMKEYGFPGYSRFVVYVNREAPTLVHVEEMPPPVEEVKMVEYERYDIVAPPPPPRIIERKSESVRAEIIDFPDVEASFPGGAKNLKKWINENRVYPEEAKENGEQGKVYVNFVVETDGRVTNVKVIRRGVSKSLDREAKRIVESMPRWTAGEINGNKVRTRCALPITFSIEEEN